MFSFSLSAEVSPEAGKTIFKNYCASCHAKNMVSKLTGPALGGVQERWENEEDLYAWIRNSQKMIFEVGHPRALELWEEWKPTQMNAFENLTDDEIASTLVYIDYVYTGKDKATGGGGGDVITAPVEEKSNGWMYGLLLAGLALLAVVLTRIISNLDVLAAAKDGNFGLVVLAGYTTVTNATNLGRQQGYQPDQPIKFSHVTHAGINKIECQYCHDGARRSKHSVIPAANTCMNCHKAIVNGSEYGTAELTKIYASVGFDPSSGKYLENYENIPDDEYKAIYQKWIGDQYLEKSGLAELDSEGKEAVRTQWDGIVSSLTNGQKKKVQGPIEWTRIHNLPDHVYFNHAQHVTAGKVECQTCHGEIEKMEVVQQHSPLSMGWCINCHRQTGVQFKENEYYTSYGQYHEEIQSGDREKVTVAEIGGLECQKCHY